jgi:phage tail tube protein FII
MSAIWYQKTNAMNATYMDVYIAATVDAEQVSELDLCSSVNKMTGHDTYDRIHDSSMSIFTAIMRLQEFL